MTTTTKKSTPGKRSDSGSFKLDAIQRAAMMIEANPPVTRMFLWIALLCALVMMLLFQNRDLTLSVDEARYQGELKGQLESLKLWTEDQLDDHENRIHDLELTLGLRANEEAKVRMRDE